MTQSFAGMQCQRLEDPDNVAGSEAKRLELEEKIVNCLTRMYKLPQNGGNPFLFALTWGKKHILCKELPGFGKGGDNRGEFGTAATDGKKFFWHPDFLDKLLTDEVPTVMSHESYHILFDHQKRLHEQGFDAAVANWAVDYSVNNTVEEEHERSHRDQKYKLWEQGALGKPLDLATLLHYIDGAQEAPKGPCVFVDKAVRLRAPESIYDEIMRHMKKSPRLCKPENGGCGALSINPKTGRPIKPPPYNPGDCPKCGSPPPPFGSMDSHMPSALNKQEVMHEMLKASEAAKQMRGTAPAAIEEMLKELHSPTLRARDIIRNACIRYKRDAGRQNDYRRGPRRRGLAYDPPIYNWRKKAPSHNWVAMQDTSGSMSDQDIVDCVSELQCIGGEGTGFLVPVDADVYWDRMIQIDGKSDLKRAHIVGRGGTCFTTFFEQLPKRFPEGLSCVVVLTDGDIGHIPIELKPPCDVVFIVINKTEWVPPFGRVVLLRNSKP